jgi:hypothetical protein
MKHAQEPDRNPKSSGPATAKADEPKPTSYDLGISERRKAVRTLPVPLAQESDGDSGWAAFQALSSDQPKS